MGARALSKSYKRVGPPTKIDKQLVEAVLANATHELTTRETSALATITGRTRETVKKLVDEARQKLAERAEFYLDSHKQVVEDALADGDPKALDVAMKATQWGLENISFEGSRVVDKAKTGDGGSGGGNVNIMIGVKLGEKPGVVEAVEGKVVDA